MGHVAPKSLYYSIFGALMVFTIITVEVLQAITSHREYGKPLTFEAGIVRVADALDMAKGRSRIPFERGSVSIHSLSAAAIDDVEIKDGEQRPILIEILMNNSSGIYQVDGLLKAKLRGSGLEPYVEVVAHIDTEGARRRNSSLSEACGARTYARRPCSITRAIEQRDLARKRGYNGRPRCGVV